MKKGAKAINKQQSLIDYQSRDIGDLILEQKIIDLQQNIQNWSKEKGLWDDAGFKSYQQLFDSEPNEYGACVTVLWTEGCLNSMFNGYSYNDYLDEFAKFIDTQEFYCENIGACLYGFYSKNKELNQKYLDFYEWQWITELIKPNYTSLYEEVFEYFHQKPEVFYRLSPRKFEILISEIFSNQGYRTELGKGQNDGGVDVRLYKKDEIDQIVTLVQVKKYKPDAPIKLEAVSSLAAMVNQENANRGLFITTSRYLPGVIKFAQREKSRLTLANSADVSRWCLETKNILNLEKSLLFDDQYLLNMVKHPTLNGLPGTVLVANIGYGMISNDFCVVVKDSPEVALLMRLPSNLMVGDGSHETTGFEIPILDQRILKNKVKENVFRAKKKDCGNGRIGFYGNGNLYFQWNGKPCYYNFND